MGKYSIKELERLTGIKAHTIRAWEKRYRVIRPARTASNIRYYSDHDLKRLINISILNNHGHKISKIASLSAADINQKVSEISEEHSDYDIMIDQLTMAMIEMNEQRLNKLLYTYIMRLGVEKTMLRIIYPFLEKTGVLWLTNKINAIQEHFATNLIRQKIVVAIDSIANDVHTNGKSIVLFLPENELHEMGLLFCNYLLKKNGHRTYYLGQSVPLADLIEVSKLLRPDCFLTCLTTSLHQEVLEEFVALLSKKFHTSDIYIAGRGTSGIDVDFPKNTHFIQSANDLMIQLSKN